MFKHERKRTRLQRALLFFALPLLLLSPVVSLVSGLVAPEPTSALTAPEIEKCISDHNGKTYSEPYFGTLNACIDAGVCKTTLVPLSAPPKSKVACSRPTNPGGAPLTTAERVARQEAILKRIYGEALVAEFCKSNQGAQEAAACRTDFTTTASTCLDAFFANGYEGSDAPVFPSINTTVVARCVSQERGSSLTSTLNVFNKTQANAIAEANKVAQPQLPEQSEELAGSSCNIEGIGWLVCPVMRFMGKLVDGTYVVVSAMLAVPPLSTSTSEPLFQAWAIMRNFANVSFVMAFLVIIYSQITGVGLSNYGLKKLLPRIIIAAILVNVSFWVCALAVDLSNIAGSSMKGLFDGISNQVIQGNRPSWLSTGGGVAWDALALTVLGGAGILAAGALYTTLAAFLPILVTAVVAIVTVVVILTARQAIIILLIVISPLAFVAFLLPNTQKWFERWRDTFMAMLIMFPVIGLIFGTSKLASVIIMNSADDLEQPVQLIVQIMGAGVAIIPLIISPLILKVSTGVLGRIGAFVNNPNKGPFDSLKKGAQGIADDRGNKLRERRLNRAGGVLERSGGALGASGSRRRRTAAVFGSLGSSRRADKTRERAVTKGIADETEQEYIAKRSLNERSYAERMAGGDDAARVASVQASAQSAVDKLDVEGMKNREVLIRSQADPRDLMGGAAAALTTAIKSGDVAGARAAQSILLNGGSKGIDVLEKTLTQAEKPGGGLVDASGKSTDVSSSLRKDLSGAGLKAKNNALATWSFTDGKTLELTAKAAGTYAPLNDKELVGQSLDNIRKAVAAGAVSPDQAKRMLSSDSLGSEFDQAKRKAISVVIGGLQSSDSQLDIPHSPSPEAPPAQPQPPQRPIPENRENQRVNNRTESGLWVPGDDDK